MAEQINVFGLDIANLVLHIVGMEDTGPVVRCSPVSPRDLQPSWAWKRVGVLTTGPDTFMSMATRYG